LEYIIHNLYIHIYEENYKHSKYQLEEKRMKEII